MKGCIFCKIIKKEIPTQIVYEDDLVIAFPDTNPITPIHILIIPKKHITSINALTENTEDEKIMGRIIMVTRKIASEKGIAEKGFKLLIRTGRDGGQEVSHIHLHLLGGGRMKENIELVNNS